MQTKFVNLAAVALPLTAVVLLWSACASSPPPQATAPKPLPVVPRAPLAVVASADPLAAGFDGTLRPFVQTYCVSCHGGVKPEAELDLSRYTTLDSVTNDPRRWHLVLERLQAREMPPEDAKQHPTPAQSAPVVAWLQAMNTQEVKRHAGDPGIVLARRLSNAEYDNTVRDLTGVDIRPAKEFPVDPANEAGFDNSGESLAMSPSMVKKYLEAARLVADHILFKPDGLAFAPYPVVTEEDRDKYAVNRIVDFYKAQHLNYGDFFAAAWRFQHRAELGRPDAALADFAQKPKLSVKYLEKILAVVTAPGEEIGPLAAIQARWKKLPAPVDGKEPPTLRAACEPLHTFIVELRPFVSTEFANLPARGLAAGSQTMVLWKDQQYATSRLTYPAGKALQVDMTFYAQSDPLMLIPPAADTAARVRYEESFARFCATFPSAFYIPERARMFLTNANDIASDLRGHRLLTAGFHSQMGYFRDDAPLYDLVLDEAEQHELDTLWRELDFITLAPFRQLKQFIWFERAEPPSLMLNAIFNAFRSEDDDIISEAKIQQLAETYTANAKKLGVTGTALKAVEDYFVSINTSIRTLESAQQAAKPAQLKSLLAFAARAYRRPLTVAEQDDLVAFYGKLREAKLDHEDAIRDSVVAVLMSPAFTYRVALPNIAAQAAAPAAGRGLLASAARPASAVAAEPLTDYELASRLSYFLWSSMPDDQLLAHAAAGDLKHPAVLAAEGRRMMQDTRIRSLATEFAGNWLDIRRFEEHNAVDRARFPEFTNELRAAMFEEPVRFFTDVVRHNSSVLDFIYGNYTFVNAPLAKHYGMPAPAASPATDGWGRVDNADQYSRGGLLPMAAFLTKNAPGLRTSPVKRGNWVVTKLLGERIPAPPPNVPVLPTDETKLGDLTLRQTLAQHRANPACASCHNKFDSFGLVFEGYGPVGEVRANDLAGRPVQIDATFPDGSERAGLAGLRAYFQTKVQDEFLDNLARKLTAYALSRTLILSDDLLIADMKAKLAANHYSFSTLVESLVTSPQFLNKRGPANPAGLATN